MSPPRSGAAQMREQRPRVRQARPAGAADPATVPHPRRLGWVGNAALAVGGSAQSLFLLSAFFTGQGPIFGAGSAALPLLGVGLLLALAAAPGWLELVLLYPNRVGGIAACCQAAFRPYGDILAVLPGVCYWWGWVATCGISALLAAGTLQPLVPDLPVRPLAAAFVVLFMLVNLRGIRITARVAILLGLVSTSLALLAAWLPVSFHLTHWIAITNVSVSVPFAGKFGVLTSLMSGLYLVGFCAPAFECALCHVGETADPDRQIPRALLAAALLAGVYFIGLPIIWFATIGHGLLGGQLAHALPPVFAPLFGGHAHVAVLVFLLTALLAGTAQPLAGAARTLAQLAEDGLLPRTLAMRARGTDVPVNATILTAAAVVGLLVIGDPLWLIAAANFTYLIGIALPSVAVWLLRRREGQVVRGFRAPASCITLGLWAAGGWGVVTVLGFAQFGLGTVILGLGLAASGATAYLWRHRQDHRATAAAPARLSLHAKLTGSMLLVLALYTAGYAAALARVPPGQNATVALLDDIFVAVAMMTLSVGIILPGMIAHTADQVSEAAARLVSGTLTDFARVCAALAAGNLNDAHINVDIQPLPVHSDDELGQMAANFNLMQAKIKAAVDGLNGAREGLRSTQAELTRANTSLQDKIAAERTLGRDLFRAKEDAEAGSRAKTEFLATMSHELRTPLNGMIGMAGLLVEGARDPEQRQFAETMRQSSETLLTVIERILDFARLESGPIELVLQPCRLWPIIREISALYAAPAKENGIAQRYAIDPAAERLFMADAGRIRQVALNIIGNAVKFTAKGAVSVEIRCVEERETDSLIQFVVRDTGIGIAPEERERLFTLFAQVDSSLTRRHDGVGLGLVMAARLVRSMGGDIGVTSTKAVGSTFWFTLTLPHADAQAFDLTRPETVPAARAPHTPHELFDAELHADLRLTLGEEGARQLLGGFCATLPGRVAALARAPTPEGLESLRASTHNLGLTRITEELSRLCAARDAGQACDFASLIAYADQSAQALNVHPV
jgi:signal transduction histidine kinase/amino acid transporter